VQAAAPVEYQRNRSQPASEVDRRVGLGSSSGHLEHVLGSSGSKSGEFWLLKRVHRDDVTAARPDRYVSAEDADGNKVDGMIVIRLWMGRAIMSQSSGPACMRQCCISAKNPFPSVHDPLKLLSRRHNNMLSLGHQAPRICREHPATLEYTRSALLDSNEPCPRRKIKPSVRMVEDRRVRAPIRESCERKGKAYGGFGRTMVTLGRVSPPPAPGIGGGGG